MDKVLGPDPQIRIPMAFPLAFHHLVVEERLGRALGTLQRAHNQQLGRGLWLIDLMVMVDGRDNHSLIVYGGYKSTYNWYIIYIYIYN